MQLSETLFRLKINEKIFDIDFTDAKIRKNRNR